MGEDERKSEKRGKDSYFRITAGISLSCQSIVATEQETKKRREEKTKEIQKVRKREKRTEPRKRIESPS
jgi:hypothetical protein